MQEECAHPTVREQIDLDDLSSGFGVALITPDHETSEPRHGLLASSFRRGTNSPDFRTYRNLIRNNAGGIALANTKRITQNARVNKGVALIFVDLQIDMQIH